MPETVRLAFTGYSDDTFGCSGPRIDVDHDTCASGRPVAMRVSAGGEALLVIGQYAPGACAGWLIGVSHAEDERRHVMPLPAWPISVGAGPSYYSPELVLDAPAGVTVEVIDHDPR